jgi:MoaA/NifB/PqqE/SkfB family radical SAM enzyme
MQKISNINSVHIELTDKCQAQCPMCARNHHGSAPRSFIRNSDISIDQFKKWFPKSFLAQLNNFYSCGNYGDPAFARDCLEIFQYIRESNSTTRLALHTNGGMRNSAWWSKLAKVLGKNSEVVFAVDGVKGKHELYRKNTKFDKVIENLKSFIDAGGNARVDSLVFKHNEDDVDDLRDFLLELGVEHINFFSTQRFYEMQKFEVLDDFGNIEYHLEPAQTDRFKKTPLAKLNNLIEKEYRDKVVEEADIDPKCQKENEIYVDPQGNIFPCCWIGGEYAEQPVTEILPIHYLRNLSVSVTKQMLADIGVPSCNDNVLHTDQTLFKRLDNYWQGKNKCLTCARQCSNMIYDLKSKYD